MGAGSTQFLQGYEGGKKNSIHIRLAKILFACSFACGRPNQTAREREWYFCFLNN